MFLGSTGGGGGEVTEVVTEVDIVVGSDTAPIEHVAGEPLIVHSCISSSSENDRGRGRGY